MVAYELGSPLGRPRSTLTGADQVRPSSLDTTLYTASPWLPSPPSEAVTTHVQSSVTALIAQYGWSV